jgi:hypothetical protein
MDDARRQQDARGVLRSRPLAHIGGTSSGSNCFGLGYRMDAWSDADAARRAFYL